MKQTLLIVAGTVLILAVCGVWVYLLIFGTPEPAKEFFTNFVDEGETREFVPTTAEEVTMLALGDAPLEQITTRPVAGFAFVDDASTSTPPSLLYAERGTGHIYRIDLDAKTEERVLGKTFAAVTRAVFAPNGSAVVLTSENGYEHTAYLEEIPVGSETPDTHEFAPRARNVAFVSETEVRYTDVRDGRLIGFSYDLAERAVQERFSLPFTDARVLWMPNRTLVYNKPAPNYSGGLYMIGGSGLQRIGDTEYALSALAHPFAESYAVTYAVAGLNTLVSVVRNGDGDETPLPVLALPEKCAFDSAAMDILWCAAPVEASGRTYQANWYKGTLHSQDLLWKIDTTQQEAHVLTDPRSQTGRAIDVTGMVASRTGGHLAFANKNDETLWLYTLPQEAPAEPEAVATSSEEIAE